MNTPYDKLPPAAFWRRSVSAVPGFLVDPVRAPTFKISKNDAVATAGSCFAQHLSRAIASKGFRYLVTEQGTDLPAEVRIERNFGVFSARFGNVYTVRQLRQLIERAYGLVNYNVEPWTRADGKFVDPFRPNIEPMGFACAEDLVEDQRSHLRAVRDMFSSLDVLVFTMGLTEGWEHIPSGATLPLAPGVAGGQWDPTTYRFANYSVLEVVQDLEGFFKVLRSVNSSAKILLTVSPVPLIATYSSSSVLSATTYSKAVLRVAAEEFSRKYKGVDYFPSFEIITNISAGNKYFEDDLRSVTPEGVAHVMRSFFTHYLEAGDPSSVLAPAQNTDELTKATRKQNDSIFRVVCDEESIENSIA